MKHMHSPRLGEAPKPGVVVGKTPSGVWAGINPGVSKYPRSYPTYGDTNYLTPSPSFRRTASGLQIPAGDTGPFPDDSVPGAPPSPPERAQPGPGRVPPEECQPILPLPPRGSRRQLHQPLPSCHVMGGPKAVTSHRSAQPLPSWEDRRLLLKSVLAHLSHRFVPTTAAL